MINSKFLTLNETAQRRYAVLFSYINIAFSIILTLVYTPFFLRMLGQNEYGLYSLATSVIGYLAILDLGFGNAIVVYTAKYIASGEIEKEKKLHGTIFSIYLIMSIVAIIVGGLSVIFADKIFGATMSSDEIYKIRIMFGLLTLNLAATFPFSIFSSILTAYENFIFIKLIAIFKTITLPLITIPVLLLGYKSVAAVVVATAVNLIVLLLNFMFCKKRINPKISFKNFDKELLKEIFADSFFIFLGMVVDQVNWHAGHFILGVTNGSKEVSIYAVAGVINTFFITLSVTISGVMLPKISKMVSANSSNDELTNEMIKIGRLQFYIIFFICSAFILFGRDFMILWAGKNYETSYYVAMILTIPISIPLIQNLGISILQAKNKFKFKAIATFIMAFVNIAISIPLAKIYGSIGAAC
ncbi:MAG: oligosaccharide flippase family protein, partial [Campylobacter sp.]|nr:oligosaccharide flippase family protein [Campylobacter sp.]